MHFDKVELQTIMIFSNSFNTLIKKTLQSAIHPQIHAVLATTASQDSSYAGERAY